ncbi:MAG: PDZ domain-containing protein [Pirellulaceae bacterium]|nr:PDZ domain-containing protein [Pirellulaceae bacterium]
MTASSLRRVVLGACIWAVGLSMAAGLPAQTAPPSAPSNNAADGSTLRNAARFFQRMMPRTQATHERNHTSVMAAFGDTVEKPSRSTVRVYCDGEQVALGAVVAADGFVVTKASELHGLVECALPDGRRLPAEFIGQHRETDLGMLKLDASDLTPLEWAAGEPPVVGSWLISPGSSGPVAIGVLGAAPRQVKAPFGLLGVQLQDGPQGPLVTAVVPESAAQEAGLKVNDIITHINGLQMKSQSELQATVRKHMPGDRIQVAILREEKRQLMSAVLGGFERLNERQFEQNNRLGGPELSKRKAGFPSAIQHDSVLHPYQCGGPVVGLDGKAVGLNIAHCDRVSCLALPVAVIIPVLDELKSGQLRPGPSVAEQQLVLATRADELRRKIDAWTKKVTQLQANLEESSAAEAAAVKAAEQAEADEQAKQAAEQARQTKSDLERAFQEAKQALDQATSELKMVESKVTLQGE